ncbi:hypothetical protein Q2T76_07275 [Lactobacillus sp. YT155]|uniref:hypothetical protein n=1 Tax=Lactobacillus sp. YT155 TaxID=3060955 RepID=UPI00265ECF0A|nr:hypothetical protein [Lactobacillus sp. YT155]MDO1605860.1 hypothetical protein [Lactobacillus sp. YT155]
MTEKNQITIEELFKDYHGGVINEKVVNLYPPIGHEFGSPDFERLEKELVKNNTNKNKE